MSKRIIVIGSGIVGASLAYHLAKEGAEVRVLEASSQSGGLATRQSWAWINASWGNAKPYFDLRRQSMREWRRCDKDVPGLQVNWCGSMVWDLAPDKLEAFAREHLSWGYALRLLSRADITTLEPKLRNPPENAVYCPEEGSVEPLAATQAFLAEAFQHGADIITDARVKWLREEKGRITGVITSEGDIDADEVILAAGTGTNDLLKPLGSVLKMSAPPGMLVYSQPLPEILTRLIVAPEIHVRQAQTGELVAGTDFDGADFIQNQEEAAEVIFGHVKDMLALPVEARTDRFSLGERPMPADGMSCLGRINDIPGLYLAVTHSGVTLAPAIGALCSPDILERQRDPLLEPFQAHRLITPSAG